jgi:Glycosyl transferase family 2
MTKTFKVAIACRRWPLYVVFLLVVVSFVRLLNQKEAGLLTQFHALPACQQLVPPDYDWDVRNGTVTIGPLKAATTNRTSYPEGAALCAIVFSEEAYLDEWLDYNLALGFTDIFLYDNSDTFELEKYVRAQTDSRLHVVHFPGPAMQMEAYLDCAKTVAARNQRQPMVRHTPWAAFFDLDEFLVLRQHTNVVEFLSKHCPTGQLGINWYMFSTANETLYRPLPVTKRFQYREANINQHVKSIVRLEDMNMDMAPHSHFAYMKELDQHKDTNGNRIGDEVGQPGPFNPDGPTDVAVLHHYVTKSLKEYVDKTMRGRADIKDAAASLNRPVLFKERKGLDPGTVFDDSAWQLLKLNVPKYAIYDYW